MQGKDLKLYSAVGEVLRQVRIQKNIKYTIFCYENDISTSTLNNIEKARAQIYFSKIAEVINALGLSFEEFGRLLDKELSKRQD